MQIRYPWKDIEAGQGFFIPCVNTQKVAAQGMKAALDAQVYDGEYFVGMKNGKFGVLFRRKPKWGQQCTVEILSGSG